MKELNLKTSRVLVKCLVTLVAAGMHAELALAKDPTEKTGDVLQVLIPAIGLGSTLFYEKGYDGTIQFAKAFVTEELVTDALKYTFPKTRPNGSCCESFPSAHTSAAFMGAAFIHKRYGWQYAVPAYIGATFVGYSRVESKEHYVEDVVAGAVIGTLSGFYFTEPYKGFTVTPTAGSDLAGVEISKKW